MCVCSCACVCTCVHPHSDRVYRPLTFYCDVHNHELIGTCVEAQRIAIDAEIVRASECISISIVHTMTLHALLFDTWYLLSDTCFQETRNHIVNRCIRKLLVFRGFGLQRTSTIIGDCGNFWRSTWFARPTDFHHSLTSLALCRFWILVRIFGLHEKRGIAAFSELPEHILFTICWRSIEVDYEPCAESFRQRIFSMQQGLLSWIDEFKSLRA